MQIVRVIRQSLLASWMIITVHVCVASGQPSPASHKLILHKDTTLPALPSQSDQTRGFQLFSRHWMEAVFETTVPPRNASLVSLEAFASPGEYEPVAFGLHALKDLKRVSLRATPLVSDQGHRLAGPEMRMARDMLFKYGSETTAVKVPVDATNISWIIALSRAFPSASCSASAPVVASSPHSCSEERNGRGPWLLSSIAWNLAADQVSQGGPPRTKGTNSSRIKSCQTAIDLGLVRSPRV